MNRNYSKPWEDLKLETLRRIWTAKKKSIELKELVDKLENAPAQINKKLEALEAKREQLLSELREVEESIKSEKSNLDKIPAALNDQKKLMIAKCADFKVVRAKKKQVILGTDE